VILLVLVLLTQLGLLSGLFGGSNQQQAPTNQPNQQQGPQDQKPKSEQQVPKDQQSKQEQQAPQDQ
jgi:hypothetical protein